MTGERCPQTPGNRLGNSQETAVGRQIGDSSGPPVIDRKGMLADALRESALLELTSDMFNAGMLLVGAMILVQGLRNARAAKPHA